MIYLLTSKWHHFGRRNDQTFDVQMTKLFILIYLTFNHKIYSFCTAPLPLPLYYIMTVLLPSLTLPHPPMCTTTVNVSIWFGNIFVYINFCNWEHINNRQTFLIPKTWNDPILSLKLTVTIFFFKMLAPGLSFPHGSQARRIMVSERGLLLFEQCYQVQIGIHYLIFVILQTMWKVAQFFQNST